MHTPKKNRKLRPNLKRILESILFLIAEAERGGGYLTQYEIVKSLFLADKKHLEGYGRPITFDNYTAMKNGPVASEAYNMLKVNYNADAYFDEAWPIWTSEPSPSDGDYALKYHRLKRQPNIRALSESDRLALLDSFKTVKALKFAGVRDLTHNDPAYVAAWKENGGKKAYEMDYVLLLPSQDEDAYLDLVHASKYA